MLRVADTGTNSLVDTSPFVTVLRMVANHHQDDVPEGLRAAFDATVSELNQRPTPDLTTMSVEALALGARLRHLPQSKTPSIANFDRLTPESAAGLLEQLL